jgi:hypothetical protein
MYVCMYVPWPIARIGTAKCAPRDAALDTAKSAWLLALVARISSAGSSECVSPAEPSSDCAHSVREMKSLA